MLKILAIAPQDGWAFIQAGTGIVLVRPPYTRSLTVPVNARAVTTAIARHGFELPTPDGESFATWRVLIAYLQRRIAESRSRAGEVLDESAAESLLEFAPPEILRTFLDRVETELIPNRRWQHAETLLMRMLKEPSVRQHGRIVNDTIDLLAKVKKGHEAEEAVRHQLLFETANLSSRFPKAMASYPGLERLAAEIASRGTVMNLP